MKKKFQKKNLPNDVLIAAMPVFTDAIKMFFFENKTRKCTIFGYSMEPFLSFGRSVEIVPHTGRLKRGHCYAFITGSTLTIHRFIKNLNNDYALFAGDSSLVCDRVPLPNIVGELSSCQNRYALFIINTINRIFCTFMHVFNHAILIRRFRRRMIRTFSKIIYTKSLDNSYVKGSYPPCTLDR